MGLCCGSKSIRVHDNGEETVEDENIRLRRENEEKDRIIADMREKMKEMQMQIQIPGYGESSQELKPNVPELDERQKFVLEHGKMKGHYFGDDAVKGCRPHHDSEDYIALLTAIANGLREFNVKCDFKSDVDMSHLGWKIRQTSGIHALSILVGKPAIEWELFLSKDGTPIHFKAKADYIAEPSGKSIKMQDWEDSENDDDEAKVSFTTDGEGKMVRWNVTILP